MKLEFKFNDGGRENYFKGKTGDCVCRAISIATGMDYKEVYDTLNELAKSERTGKRKRKKSNARTGVYKTTYDKLLKQLGWEWKPLMTIGSGCTAHLVKDEIPMNETIICRVSHHLTCVVNGVINDTFDCSNDGTRCVYGYYYKCDNHNNTSHIKEIDRIISQYQKDFNRKDLSFELNTIRDLISCTTDVVVLDFLLDEFKKRMNKRYEYLNSDEYKKRYCLI